VYSKRAENDELRWKRWGKPERPN